MAQWDNLEEGTCEVDVMGHRCSFLPDWTEAEAAALMDNQPPHGKG